MSTVRLRRVVDGAGAVVPATVTVALVDASGRARVGWLATNEPVTEYLQGLALDGDEDLEVLLSPQDAIAIDDEGSATFYRIEIRTAHRAEVWTVQVPDSPATLELADLVGAEWIDPADIMAGQLLPDYSEASDGWVLSIDGGAPVWAEAEAGPGGGVSDHGDLTGLADDDHTQYHTDARGDARYSPLGHDHSGTYEPVDATLLRQADVDDTPANGATTAPVSSNWAYDHAADAAAHHAPVTVSDSSSIDLTLTGQQISAAAIFGTASGTVCQGDDARLSDARTPTAHATAHQHSGSDEVATATAAANAIPKAGAGGTLATGWIPDLSATYAVAAKGVTNGDSHDHSGGDGAQIAYTNLSGIPSTFAPSTHATAHQSGGGDAIKLDDLATPDDNTDLDASSSRHGLLPKLENTGTKYLRDDGTWQTVAGGDATQAFGTISISGQSDVVADAAPDTLTLVAGSNITLTTNATTDSITIAATGSGVDVSGTPSSGQYARFTDADTIEGRTAAQTRSDLGLNLVLQIACSNGISPLQTGTSIATFRMPQGMTLSDVRASVKTAPTGSTLVVDINEAGSTILGTKLSIDAGEKTSTTAASAATITDSGLADDAEITIDIDQVGSTVAGVGLIVSLIGVQA